MISGFGGNSNSNIRDLTYIKYQAKPIYCRSVQTSGGEREEQLGELAVAFPKYLSRLYLSTGYVVLSGLRTVIIVAGKR